MAKKPSLDAAYALNSPQDSVRLYKDWAPTYDADFAKARGYTYPKEVAEIFAEFSTSEDVPILDIGAGTGLVGEHLKKRGHMSLEALDISQDMLDIAAGKQIYEKVNCVDLTRPRTFGLATYGGLISAGTFTHGHLGPDVLASVLALGKPGALFVLGINAQHFETRGFKRVFGALKSSIMQQEFFERPIYDGSSGDEVSEDTALIAVFRKR